MKRVKTRGTLIGNKYPFFLENSSMKAYYLYQVVSPEMLSDYTPLLTFQKIGERTRPTDFSADSRGMNHCDIVATLIHSRKGIAKRAVDYLVKDILNRDDRRKNTTVFYENGYSFPLYELDGSNNTTKSIVIGLRDSLRWSHYRFQAGHYVDLLLTPNMFGLFEIKGDDKEIWLEPKAVYDVMDIEMTTPLNIDLGRLEGFYPKDHFTGEKKNSEMNRALRMSEWKSFDNPDDVFSKAAVERKK